MITVTIHLSEVGNPDALLVGFQTHKMIGRKTGHIIEAKMTTEWYTIFCRYIKEDGYAGKLRDFQKCDLEH